MKPRMTKNAVKFVSTGFNTKNCPRTGKKLYASIEQVLRVQRNPRANAAVASAPLAGAVVGDISDIPAARD